MAEVILITEEAFKVLTPVGGNVDFDKIAPFLKTSQMIYLQDKVGTNLLEKVKNLTESGQIDNPINAHYKELRDVYMVPILAWSACADFIRNHAFEVNNQGVVRNSPENTFLPEMAEVNVLAQHLDDKAAYQVRRMTDFIVFRSTDFPEFFTNSNGKVYPRYGANRSPWKL